MQIVRQNCENCEGPTRIACDAIYARMREMGGKLLTEATVFALDGGNDVIGLMESQDQIARQGQEMRVEIKSLGCSLSDAELQVAAMSEISSAGMILAEPNEDEIMERAQERSSDRLRTLVSEAEELASETKRILEDLEQEVVDIQGAAARTYCEEQGWDIDNLGFVERMDLNAYLRSEGYLN